MKTKCRVIYPGDADWDESLPECMDSVPVAVIKQLAAKLDRYKDGEPAPTFPSGFAGHKLRHYVARKCRNFTNGKEKCDAAVAVLKELAAKGDWTP